MEFEIKKGIPLPRSKGKPRKYDLPLEDLKVDDSIVVPLPKTKINQEQRSLGTLSCDSLTRILIRSLLLDSYLMALVFGGLSNDYD